MGVITGGGLNFVRLPLVGIGGCEISSRTEDRSKTFTSVLSCLLSEDFDPANRPLSFMMETLQGEKFIIGTGEPPYPVVSTVDSLPAKMSEPSGCRLTVQWNSTLGLLRIMD